MYIGHKHATRRGARLCACVDIQQCTQIRQFVQVLPASRHFSIMMRGPFADQRARQSFKTTTLITQTAQLADGEASHITIKKNAQISPVSPTRPQHPQTKGTTGLKPDIPESAPIRRASPSIRYPQPERMICPPQKGICLFLCGACIR